MAGFRRRFKRKPYRKTYRKKSYAGKRKRPSGFRRRTRTYKKRKGTMSLRGKGDYSRGGAFTTNQLIKGSGQKPMTVNGSKDLTGDIYIARREFLGNIYASATGLSQTAVTTPLQSTFNVNTYNINAALATTFPWLSQVAKNFTFYKFHGLVFEYKPTSGEFGNLSTNALGKVVMCTQYDPDAPNFVSSQQMENYDYATACKPAEHMLHGVETKAGQRGPDMLYTRTGPTTKDEVLTDLGDFQIATEGIPVALPITPGGAVVTTVNVAVGELWVAYKCQLSRANIYGLNVTNPSDQHIGLTLGAAANSTKGNTATALGAGPTNVGTYTYLNVVQKRLFNPGSGVTQYCPKITNTLGTQVWGSVGHTTAADSGTKFFVVFPPGTNGSWAITMNITVDVMVNSYFNDAFAGSAGDLVDLIASGYTVPNGLIGTLAPATNVTFTIDQELPDATGSFVATSGNGVYSTGPCAASSTAFSKTIFVNFTSPPGQLPFIKCSITTPQAASHGLAMTITCCPTTLNSQN